MDKYKEIEKLIEFKLCISKKEIVNENFKTEIPAKSILQFNFVEMEKSLIIQMKDKFEELSKKIEKQILLQKDILNFNETCDYLDLSASHLYKLTSQKRIPHFCPLGKKLYFNRKEVDNWLMSNKIHINDDKKQKSDG